MYFDTLDNADFISNKIYKKNHRKKIRLRSYGLNGSNIKFEIKYKFFGRQLKETISISNEDAMSLINKDYSVLLNYDNHIAKQGYAFMVSGNYRPVSLILYDRKAFVHQYFSTRVTLDNNIRYSTSDFDILKDNKNLTYTNYDNNSVLEVKYDRFLLPQLQDIINNCDFNGEPASKFGASRRMAIHYWC